VIATSRVARPFARAQIGGMFPPWRKDHARWWSKWLSRMLRSFESMIDSMAMPSSAKVSASHPWRAAMPSGEGTGQRVYQSTSGLVVEGDEVMGCLPGWMIG
jgi:hypothetical protein